MQTVPGYPTDLTSATPTVVVSHNGVVRGVESVTVARELASSLPAQVAGGSGITAATGDIVWAQDELVSSRSAHPWNGAAFPPKPGDAVTVDLGFDGFNARRLTGVIDNSTGSVGSGEVSSSVVDPIDKTDRPVTIEPLAATLPGPEGGEYFKVGITPTYFTDRVLRASGFYATPPVEGGGGNMLSVPLMGSAIPERGFIFSSEGTTSLNPVWAEVPWGQAADSLTAFYTPAIGETNTGKLDVLPLQITLMAGMDPGTSGSSLVRARWDLNNNYIQLVVTSSRSVQAQAFTGGVLTTVCTLAANTITDADTFTLRVNPGGGFTIYANNGINTTGSWSVPAIMRDTVMGDVHVYAPNQTGVPIGGVQVSFSGSPTARDHVRSAHVTPAAEPITLIGSPAMIRRNALDVLREQSGAECAAMWIDEFGAFRWVNRDKLVSTPTVATLTSKKNLLDIGWESTTSSLRSQVGVSYRVAAPDLSPIVNRTAWEGSGETLESGQVSEQFISPDADTEWINPDLTFTVVGAVGSAAPFNKGNGSFTGGVLTEDGQNDTQATASHVTTTGERIDDRTFKVTTSAAALPAGKSLALKSLSNALSLVEAQRGVNLPVLRARLILTFADAHTTGVNLGPVNAPALEHDAGHWIQLPGAVQNLANWLSAQVSEPHPVIRDLPINPDPRLQLADIVQIEDPDRSGLSIKALITGISESFGSGGYDQTLTVRVLTAQFKYPTLAEVDAVLSGSLTTFDASEAGNTLAAFDFTPLT